MKDQYAADAERAVAPACAEHKVLYVGIEKIFHSGAGVGDMMYGRLFDRASLTNTP